MLEPLRLYWEECLAQAIRVVYLVAVRAAIRSGIPRRGVTSGRLAEEGEDSIGACGRYIDPMCFSVLRIGKCDSELEAMASEGVTSVYGAKIPIIGTSLNTQHCTFHLEALAHH